MSEPETITLRRLPGHHVLRKDIDVIAFGKHLSTTVISAGKRVGELLEACYCRAEDYPPEYDKPAIDPGEGWRLLEPGEMPEKGDQFFSEGEWTASSNWVEGDPQDTGYAGILAYRRRITPQPDRLTELRQQCERQAKRIEELEHSLAQYKQLFDNALSCVDKVFQKDVDRNPLLPDFVPLGGDKFKAVITLAEDYKRQAAQIESLKTQVRSAEEALRLEKQRCDSTSIELGDVCCERDDLKQQLKDAYERLDDILNKNVNADQALAWLKVAVTLGECVPNWNDNDHICARDAACNTIRLLATQNKSLIEQSNKTHEANVELQRQVQQLAKLEKAIVRADAAIGELRRALAGDKEHAG